MPSVHVPPTLKVLFATPECAPLVKTGGLGDVSAALPPALREIGIDGEEQFISESAIVPPLKIGQEVARTRLHLDTGETSVRAQRQDVRATPAGQRYLVQRRPAEPEAQPRRRTDEFGARFQTECNLRVRTQFS